MVKSTCGSDRWWYTCLTHFLCASALLLLLLLLLCISATEDRPPRGEHKGSKQCTKGAVAQHHNLSLLTIKFVHKKSRMANKHHRSFRSRVE
ncbi:hypothetical protein F5Y17DRAFT_415598 [Xylariaceae sp. FL0594]|nr:hypothetical protein F5Y17DRAFT_415598 [Xylariaceae sp. FL0594]